MGCKHGDEGGSVGVGEQQSEAVRDVGEAGPGWAELQSGGGGPGPKRGWDRKRGVVKEAGLCEWVEL